MPLHRRDHLGMTVPHERHAEPRGEIDVSVAIGIDDVCALRVDPHDRVVTSAGLLFAPPSPSGQRRALARREAFDPCFACGSRNRAQDGWKCITAFHSGVLARRPSGTFMTRASPSSKWFGLPGVEDDGAFARLAKHVVAIDQQDVDFHVVLSACFAQILDDGGHVVPIVVGDS